MNGVVATRFSNSRCYSFVQKPRVLSLLADLKIRDPASPFTPIFSTEARCLPISRTFYIGLCNYQQLIDIFCFIDVT